MTNKSNHIQEQFPRRNQLQLCLPVELAIRKAMLEIENLIADTKLTDATIHLQNALGLVSDYIDEDVLHISENNGVKSHDITDTTVIRVDRNSGRTNLMPIEVKATFTGKDGSCGFKNNTEHTIYIYHIMGHSIQITDGMRNVIVEYESMIAFLNNWDNIRKVS